MSIFENGHDESAATAFNTLWFKLKNSAGFKTPPKYLFDFRLCSFGTNIIPLWGLLSPF